KGDEVSRHLSQDSATAKVPIIYMSGFGADLKPDQVNNANVIGSLNKPFTSDLLLRTVEKYMPKGPSAPQSRVVEVGRLSAAATEPVSVEREPYVAAEPVWQSPQPTSGTPTALEPASAANEKPWSETSEAAQSEAAGIAA